MYAIAIDGPAGAGKSSVAKAAAKALGFVYVDTGALYRTVGLYLLRSEVDPADAEAVEPKLRDIQVDLKYEDGVQHVILNGEDVSGLIRTPEVSMAASACASVPAVRKFLFSAQVDMAKKYNVIMDGPGHRHDDFAERTGEDFPDGFARGARRAPLQGAQGKRRGREL